MQKCKCQLFFTNSLALAIVDLRLSNNFNKEAIHAYYQICP